MTRVLLTTTGLFFYTIFRSTSSLIGFSGFLSPPQFRALNERDLHFQVEVKIGDRVQLRSTDGLIGREQFNQRLPETWMTYQGIGFEVRSCYQIGDSKRIQADYDMSLALKENNILPVMLVFCSTSLRSPLDRLSKSWELYEGMDSFNLVESITGFNLYKFLEDNSDLIRPEIQNIFNNF